jgi:hypothetical protein
MAVRGWVGFVEATSLEWAERRDLAPDVLMRLWADLFVGLLAQLGVPPAPVAG